jgi:hypothetical protein
MLMTSNSVATMKVNCTLASLPCILGSSIPYSLKPGKIGSDTVWFTSASHTLVAFQSINSAYPDTSLTQSQTTLEIGAHVKLPFDLLVSRISEIANCHIQPRKEIQSYPTEEVAKNFHATTFFHSKLCQWSPFWFV